MAPARLAFARWPRGGSPAHSAHTKESMIMEINIEHVHALVRNHRTAWPNASKQLAADWAATQYVTEHARLAHHDRARVDETYDMVYNEAINS